MQPNASASVSHVRGSESAASESANAAEHSVMLHRPPNRSTARPIGSCATAPPTVPAVYASEIDDRLSPSSAMMSSMMNVTPADVPKNVPICATTSTAHTTQP